MKIFFKFCISKILFFLLIAHTGVRPAAIVPAAMATEELTALAMMSFAAISQVLAQYRQPDKNEDEMLLVNIWSEFPLPGLRNENDFIYFTDLQSFLKLAILLLVSVSVIFINLCRKLLFWKRVLFAPMITYAFI